MVKKAREGSKSGAFRLGALFVCLFAGLTFALLGAGIKYAKAEAANSVPLSALDAWKVANWWGANAAWTSDGAKMTIEGNTDGSAWQKGGKINWDGALNDVFDVTNGQTVAVKFKLGLKEAATSSVNGEQFDIIVKSGEKGLIRLRMFYKNGGEDNGSHPVDVYKDESWTSYVSDTWVQGDASLGSEFELHFSTDGLLMARFNGSDELRTLDNEAGDLKKALAADLEAMTSVNFEIKGDAGFKANVDLVVTSINGQSLANDGTSFTDTQAPVIVGSPEAQISAGEQYTLPVYANDVLTPRGDIAYSLDFGGADPDDYEYTAGKTFTLLTAKAYTLTLSATDSAGNSASEVYNIEATDSIAPPAFATVPVTADKTVEKGGTMVFAKPDVTDSTGSCTVKLKLFNSGDELLAELSPLADGSFKTAVPYSLQSGVYKISYAAENKGGVTETEKQSFNVSVAAFYGSDLALGCGFAVNADGAPLADYVPSGVRIRTAGNWQRFAVGKDNAFDARQGKSVKFTVPKTTTGGAANDLMAGRVDYVIYNPTVFDAQANAGGSLDEAGNIVENYAMLGVWCGTGADRATNVYVKTAANGQWAKDITDTGWIKTSETNEAISFYMMFTKDGYFAAERTGGMQAAENDKGDVKKELDKLYAVWGTDALASAVTLGNLSAPKAMELILTESDGQSFANTNGTLTHIRDAVLHVNNIPDVLKKDESYALDVYGKDLVGGAKTQLKITDPEGTETVADDANYYTFTPALLGKYRLEISITGANGVKVSHPAKEVFVKTLADELEIETDGVYAVSGTVGGAAAVLGLVADEKRSSYKIEVVKPDGSAEAVTAGAQFTFAKSGIYKFRYTAYDKALPEATAFIKEITVNVIDDKDPVITLEKEKLSAKTGEKIDLGAITVTEDSEYEITVRVTKPDGTKFDLQAVEGRYFFTADSAGKYTVVITVTDLYDNTVSKTVEVDVSAKKGGCGAMVPFGGASGGIVGAIVLIFACAALLLTKKVKG